MSPSLVTIDTSPDFNFGGTTTTTTTKNGTTNPSSRTLLLAPPSVASEGSLTSLLPSYDRTTTDLQMLDRLSAGLVTLPPATYDTILLLTSTDGTRRAEAATLLSREVFAALVPAMKAGARLKTQDGKFFEGAEAREAVLAGLVEKEGGVYEKIEEEEVVVPLRFGKKKNNGNTSEKPKAEVTMNGGGAVAAHSSAGPAVDKVTVDMAGKPTTLDMVPPSAAATRPTPAGVGFDFGDDLDDDDDELIDEDDLMTEEDLNRPIQIRMSLPFSPLLRHLSSLLNTNRPFPCHTVAPECAPQPGKKRRACKDCTCGLAERLNAEDKARRAKADSDLNTLKLKSEDLNELDFTVQGKTGSCGSCSLGDAFRCADCPYSMSLPPFPSSPLGLWPVVHALLNV